MQLSIVTCLAENTYPLAQMLSHYLSDRLKTPVTFEENLDYNARKQNLASGQISLGFMCGLLYTMLNAQKARLQPLVAPVSLSALTTSPQYYSYLIVRKTSPYQNFTDLGQSCFCINEQESFSGCQIMRYHLAKRGKPKGFFSRVIESGSHMQSIQKVLSKEADSATIDHTLFEYWAKNNPDLARDLWVMERLGPFPMPPLVISKHVPKSTKQRIRQVLLEMPKEILKEFDLLEFQKVNGKTYDAIREAAKLGSKVSFT